MVAAPCDHPASRPEKRIRTEVPTKGAPSDGTTLSATNDGSRRRKSFEPLFMCAELRAPRGGSTPA